MKRELEDDPPSPSIDYVLPALRPEHLLSDDEYHTTTISRKGREFNVCVSGARADGTLVGGCMARGVCALQHASMDNFAPAENAYKTARRRAQFFEAYGAYTKAFNDGNEVEAKRWRTVVERLRVTMCQKCSVKGRQLSKTQQACKDEWDRMKAAACAQNGGCQHSWCPERGDDARFVLQADHGTNDKMERLSSYFYWAARGGVCAMQQEEKQIKKWVCAFCHRLEATSGASRRRDPNTMLPGKRNGTPEENKQYMAHRHALRVYPKQQYVDARKRVTGECAHCHREVIAGQEQAFDWDHRVEATKTKGGLFGRNGGVSGLVANDTHAAALEKVRHLLDAEMDKCDLLCKNCHHRKTNGYPRRAPVA